jgi:hypothetical protein
LPNLIAPVRGQREGEFESRFIGPSVGLPEERPLSRLASAHLQLLI